MRGKKPSSSFEKFLIKRKKRVDDLLLRHLNLLTKGGPKKFNEAIKYGVLNGGKRLRPILIYAVGDAFGANLKDLDAPAIAIEMIHSFSLIHDDLPAMDDDDLRRGRPTCHIAFDEATAILAGDALSILAFEVLSESKSLSADKKIKMIKVLAKASGSLGIAGGQYLDLHTPKKPTKNSLEKMYSLKTGSLVNAAIELGALASGVSGKRLAKLKEFALNIGLAFQIKDDILNIEGDAAKIGKNTGTDKKNNKITYPSLVGLKKAKIKLDRLYSKALNILQDLKIENSYLSDLAKLIIARDF